MGKEFDRPYGELLPSELSARGLRWLSPSPFPGEPGGSEGRRPSRVLFPGDSEL